MARVTFTGAARHVGLSTNGLRDLIARGVCPDPRVVGLDTFRLAYIAHLRAVASGHVSADGDLDLTAERARLSKEQADAQALKNAEARGELVRGEAIEGWLVRLLGAMTQRIRAIPSKAAPEVRATRSDAEGEALLASFHDDALTEIADALRRPAEALARIRSGAAEAGGGGGGGGCSATPAGDGQPVGGSREDAEPGVERGAGPVADGEG